jgi:hypothetical protein
LIIIFCCNIKVSIINIGDQSFYKSRHEHIIVPTDSQTNINIKKKVVKSLSRPYGQCDDNLIEIDPSLYQAFDGKGKKYRRKDCLDIMVQRFVAKNCDCIFNALITEDNGKKYCQSNESFDCIQKFVNQTNEDELYNICPFECNSIDYDISISTSSATSFDYLKEYLEYNYEDEYPKYFNIATSAFRVNIYFSELTYTRIVEVPNYTPISLISNIGGTLGLFLGMSLLSFIEIVDLVIQMILASTRLNSNQIENY